MVCRCTEMSRVTLCTCVCLRWHSRRDGHTSELSDDNVRAAQITLVILRVVPAVMNVERHKYTRWISAGPGLIAYLEIHLCGWAWDSVYDKKAQSSWEVPAHSDWWSTARPFTSPCAQSQLWCLRSRSSSWLSSINTHTLQNAKQGCTILRFELNNALSSSICSLSKRQSQITSTEI